MRTYNTIFYIMTLALILTASPLKASQDVGNGGNVVRTANGYRLLDLVEAGAADGSPIEYLTPDPRLISAVDWAFFGKNEVTQRDKQVLVSYLSMMPSGQSFSLAAGMLAYKWHWIDGKLNDIPDVDSSVHYDPKDIVQTAVRRLFAITIRRDIWNQLDSRNRAALILHEVLYAYVIPQQVKDPATGTTYLRQSSPITRQVIGDLFANGYADLMRYTVDGNPMFGATLPREYDTTAPAVSSDLYMDETQTPKFNFGSHVFVRKQYQIDANWSGWIFSSFSKTSDWVQGNFYEYLNKEISFECNLENRTQIETLGKTGMLNINGATFPAKEGLANILVSGEVSTFSVEFGSYDGRNGSVFYLKPTITKQKFQPYSKAITSEVPQIECETRLKNALMEMAKTVLR